jgi:glutathione synthase/RimK-type ligase-like ATP-grasp enzyme
MENSNPNMRSLAKACGNLNIEYTKLDQFGNLLGLKINGETFYFTKVRVPIANESVAYICVNKAYTYWVFENDLPMPKTKAYLDPYSDDEDVRNKSEFKKRRLIVDDIMKNFTLPLVVKMNSGSQGKHVYKCKTRWQVSRAVKAVFYKKQKDYDSTVLAQQFIEIKNEYRAISMDGEVILLYEKASDQKITNLSPLHNEDGRAVLVEDDSIKSEIVKIIERSPTMNRFDWLGIDIVRDTKGAWWVLELNSRPGFSYFIRDNGDEEIVKVYEKLLTRIRDGKK